VSRHGIGVFRFALLFATGLALFVLYFVVLWPLSYQLSEGPYFTYEYLRSSSAIWAQLYRLFGWLPWLSPWSRPTQDITGGLWLILYSALFALYLAGFLLLRWSARAGSSLEQRVMLSTVVAFATGFQVVLFLMPGVFTTDMFSYVIYGRIAGSYHGNPFIEFPALYDREQVVQWIPAIWLRAPSMYGPLWVDLSAALDRFVGSAPIATQVLAYRAVANVAQAINVGLFTLIVGRFGIRVALPSVLLFAWNPLLLFEFAGSGHNDVLMLTFVLLAVALCVRRWMPAAIVALALSAMVKYVTVLALPLFLVYWARRQQGLARQVAALIGGGLLFAAVIAALYAPWYVGPETFGPLLGWTKEPHYANSPTDMLANDLARLIDPGGQRPQAALEETRQAFKWLSLLVLGAYCTWEALRVRTLRQVLAGSARVLLVFLLVVDPWVLPWYFSWPLTFGLLAGWETATARVAFLFSLTAPAVMHFTSIWGTVPANTLNAIYLAPLLLPVLPRLFTPVGPAASAGWVAPLEQGAEVEPTAARAA